MTLYYLLLMSSVVVGLVTKDYLTGAAFLAVSFFLPVLLIIYYDTSYNSGQKNRDRIMAETIQEAQKHGTTLAIVGAHHAEGILDQLPSELDVEFHPPAYGRFSREHLAEILAPLFKMFSLLFTLYLVILWFSVNLYLMLS